MKEHVDCCRASGVLTGKDVSLLLFAFCLYRVTTVPFIRVSHYLFIHYLSLCTKHVLENRNTNWNKNPPAPLAFRN